MGAGHLNAFGAYQQLNGCQWKSNVAIPSISWDYDRVNAKNTQEYVFKSGLKANSFVAITLSWDRLVELNDKNNNQKYDVRKTFKDQGLNNLDVYLVKENGKNNEVVVCASVSEVDNVEHIFCPVSTNGNYKIRVQFQNQVNEAVQPYALAWWTVGEK